MTWARWGTGWPIIACANDDDEGDNNISIKACVLKNNIFSANWTYRNANKELSLSFVFREVAIFKQNFHRPKLFHFSLGLDFSRSIDMYVF